MGHPSSEPGGAAPIAPRRRIGFDLACLAHPSSPGVRRAALELWRALHRVDTGHLRFVPLTASRGASARRWRQVTLPRLVRRLGLDGFHATVSALPLAVRVPVVQTVHEVPWRTGEAQENTDRRHRAWARSRRAVATIVPSRCTARALAAERGDARATERDIHVVPWGVGAPFDAGSAGSRRSGSPPRRVVLVGGTRPKKRLDRALAALAELDPACELLVTGAADPARDGAHLARCRELAERLGVAARVHRVGAIDDRSLATLIARADAHLVVSASEGFALPALEAAALGTPSVVERGSAAFEAASAQGASDAVATFESGDDAGAVARAIERAFAFDDADRARLSDAARAWDWERTAQRVARLWCTLAP